mmetsp:Transcript_25838/g.44053  ORF Transcript_25838/g.44053 Transcript_25838/m.44053 type:complete len:97 (-) Transcript_25838:749-1039(-)
MESAQGPQVRLKDADKWSVNLLEKTCCFARPRLKGEAVGERASDALATSSRPRSARVEEGGLEVAADWDEHDTRTREVCAMEAHFEFASMYAFPSE